MKRYHHLQNEHTIAKHSQHYISELHLLLSEASQIMKRNITLAELGHLYEQIKHDKQLESLLPEDFQLRLAAIQVKDQNNQFRISHPRSSRYHER